MSADQCGLPSGCLHGYRGGGGSVLLTEVYGGLCYGQTRGGPVLLTGVRGGLCYGQARGGLVFD